MPKNYICVVTDNGSSLSLKLAKSLTTRGWKVCILRFPEYLVTYSLPLPPEINEVVLKDTSEEHLQQQLNAIASNHGSVGTFIHLNPFTQTNLDNVLSMVREKAILKHVFLIAKHLKKSLNEAALHGHSCFFTVTSLNGKFGLGEKTDFGVISAGLFGLTKTLNLEWEPVSCRTIDLHPELDDEKATANIIAELYDPNRLIVEVGYSLQGRSTLVADEFSIVSKNYHTNKHISPDSVFLVSGGAKGITAQCVIKLAQQSKCKFILVGRSKFIDEPEWSKGCYDEIELKKRIIADITSAGKKPLPVEIQKVLKGILSQREIAATLEAIERVGGKAQYISVDVTNSLTLKEQVTSVVERLGAITGIIHGAGNLADKLIEKKSEQDFEAVYAAKIKGLESLLGCVNPSQLQNLILFSSAAGFYGNVGQSDYAIANEILNKFAHLFQRRYPQCHVAAFNWGPWDGGMVTPQLKEIFAQRNIEVIPIEVGAQIFVDELTAGKQEGSTQILVGGSLATLSANLGLELKTYRIHRKLTLEENPFLKDHIIGGNSVLPMTFAVAWIANLGEQLYPGYKFFSCENYRVLKGIVFEQSQNSEYIIDFKEIHKSQANEIELSATIWSEVTGKIRYHYTTAIKLLSQIPTAPIYESCCLQHGEKKMNFFPYEDGTLFHGLSFQGIKNILMIDNKKIVMECSLPFIDDKTMGQFPVQSLNPIALDVQFQSMLLWVKNYHDAASLPLYCQHGEYFEKILYGNTFYVSLEVVSTNQTKLIANVITHDIDGKIYSRVFGAEVSISKQLNKLFIKQSLSTAGI